MAYKAIVHIRDYTPKMLLTVGIAALSFIILTQKIGSKNVNEDTVIISVVFVVFYTLVMIMMNSGKYQSSAIALLLFCCVVSEAAIGNTSHYVMQQQKTYYTSDYDKFVAIKKSLDERENNEFYRMELTDLRTRMDPSWYDYNGVSIFSSMAYETTSNLLSYLGVDGNFINSYTYNGYQTPVFNMMTSLKYVVDNTTNTPVQSEDLFNFAVEISKFKAYENKYHLNIGYSVDKSILGWNYSDENPFIVQNDYFERSTGIADVFVPLQISNVDYSNINEFTSGLDNGELTFFRSVNDSDASFTLSYEITESGNYYIFAESSNIENVSISYSDTVYDHNFDSEHIVGIGYVEAGDTVYVDVPINEGNSGYVDIYLNKLDIDKFKKGYEQLKAGQLNTEVFEDTHIKGTATATEDSIFYTSIPYDESWQIYVDGERISIEEMQECKLGNGFIGFYLDAGEHEIEFKYVARGLSAGAIISVATILILAIAFIVLRKKKPVAAILSGYGDTVEINTVIYAEENIIEEKAETTDNIQNSENNTN